MSDENNTQVIDGETGQVDPSPPSFGTLGKEGRRIDLSSLRDVRIELAKLYRMVDAGEVTSADGGRRGYVLDLIAKVITVEDIERRLQQLEDKQTGSGSQPRRLAPVAQLPR